MRTGTLVRRVDPSGVSGTGAVAEVTEFHDGQTVVSWFGKYHSVEVWPSASDMLAVHGHGDEKTTHIAWNDQDGGHDL